MPYGLHPKGRPFESDSAHHISETTCTSSVVRERSDCPCFVCSQSTRAVLAAVLRRRLGASYCPGAATHKIKTPSRFNRRAFVAGVSLLAASKTADATTTRQLLDRGGLENKPLFGRHPSSAKQAGINAGIHPMNFVVSADSVRFALHAFPLAFLKVEAFQKWCNAHPSSL